MLRLNNDGQGQQGLVWLKRSSLYGCNVGPPGRMDTLKKDAAEVPGGSLRQAGQPDEDAWKRNVQEQLDKLQDSLAQSQVRMNASWVDWKFQSCT